MSMNTTLVASQSPARNVGRASCPPLVGAAAECPTLALKRSLGGQDARPTMARCAVRWLATLALLLALFLPALAADTEYKLVRIEPAIAPDVLDDLFDGAPRVAGDDRSQSGQRGDEVLGLDLDIGCRPADPG